MDQSRRKFFSGVGLFGAIVAGASVPVAVHIHEQKKKQLEDLSHLAPESSTTLMLSADNRTAEEKQKENPPIIGNGFYIQPMGSIKETNKVSMSVGKDDRLWIKVGDKWARVALEDWCDPRYCDPAEV